MGWPQGFFPDQSGTSGPSPATVKPAPAKRFTIVSANCQSYDGDRSAAAWTSRAKLMAKYSPDVVLVQETSDPGRKVLCATLGKGWRSDSNGKSVAVLSGPRTKPTGLKRVVNFGTAFGHGAVLRPLKVGSARVDVISQHTRPGDVASNAQKDTARVVRYYLELTCTKAITGSGLRISGLPVGLSALAWTPVGDVMLNPAGIRVAGGVYRYLSNTEVAIFGPPGHRNRSKRDFPHQPGNVVRSGSGSSSSVVSDYELVAALASAWTSPGTPVRAE